MLESVKIHRNICISNRCDQILKSVGFFQTNQPAIVVTAQINEKGYSTSCLNDGKPISFVGNHFSSQKLHKKPYRYSNNRSTSACLET